MESGTYNAITPLTRPDPIEGLARALDAHRAWLADVHHVLACRALSTDEDLARLEGWCHLGRFLAEQAADARFSSSWRDLSALHRKVHRLGREIAQTAAEDGVVTREAYAAFAGLSERLLADASRLERAGREDLGATDATTGALRERAVRERLEVERARALRSGRPCALAVVIVASAESSPSATVGDRALAAVAGACQALLRPYDLVSREGVDGLLVCLPETNQETARDLLRRRLRLVKLAAEVTTAIGVASLHTAASVDGAIVSARGGALAERRAGGALS